ncbi:peptide MFS transporter [Aliikangiella coralliicola]|uniref:Peptide MFS transporter n=1 Tax=Aliikangiella coralliicola TaxID=2592383 RepID=A0A545UB15_9GAMM|nr:peptide MFS transporter [Aliikangiella coralliicola]TQV86658.1 peptide MFS transporter [Aliikangiella coralliicola]
MDITIEQEQSEQEQAKSSSKVTHPPGLAVCFFMEMWERFSFYGLKALLIFYLTQHFLFSDADAADIFGSYFSLVYALPIFGGLLADRYLGGRKAVFFGGILLCLGHFGMAFEGEQAFTDNEGKLIVDQVALQTFFFSLALIIVGVGMLKPNISTIVGKLYHKNDPRRDAGFTIFYMGINIGSALASIGCGYLGQTYGWNYGFGLAGVGMLIGLVGFAFGQPKLNGVAESPQPQKLKQSLFGRLCLEHAIYLGLFASVFVVWQLVQNHAAVGALLGSTAILALIVVIWFCLQKSGKVEREQMFAALGLTLASVVFFLSFEQTGSSMNLFAERVVDRVVWGFEIPSSTLQALNAIFIVLLAPLFAKLWVYLASKNREPSTPMKFVLGIFQVGLGFASMAVGILIAGDGNSVNLFWLVLAHLLLTTGELCLSPIGLSMITKLSIPRLAGLMMGIWFLGTAGAQYIAGIIAKFASTDGGLSPSQVYYDTFSGIAWMGIISALVFVLFVPLLKRMMHNVH